MPGWPDGTFTRPPLSLADPTFHPVAPITDSDIDKLAVAIRRRVLRFLRKHGKLPDEDAPADDPELLEPSLLQVLGAASVQGRIALGPKAGAYVARLGRGSMDGGGEFRHGKLCADADGFSLHAGTCIPSFAREKLERLCRYAARPPLVHERLSLSTDGRTLLYKLKRRYRDGSTHVVLDPLTLIERLAALVPRPRVHLTTYHGVFAPAASLRHQIVPPAPEPVAEHNTDCDHPHPRPDSSKGGPALPQPCTRRRYSWAEMMQRVFRLEVLICPHCRGPRKLLAFLTDQSVIRKILQHLSLPLELPTIHPARSPPPPALPLV